eukprot:7445389-Lingulodinium_polyedra.AAC.1
MARPHGLRCQQPPDTTNGAWCPYPGPQCWRAQMQPSKCQQPWHRSHPHCTSAVRQPLQPRSGRTGGSEWARWLAAPRCRCPMWAPGSCS